jgi:hypothetical protein
MDRNGWPLAFLLTVVSETPVYLFALRRTLGTGHALLVALGLNLLTHPLAWSTITAAPHPLPWVFLAVESAVLVVEAFLVFILGRTPWSRRRIGVAAALAISLSANGLSAGLGLLL